MTDLPSNRPAERGETWRPDDRLPWQHIRDALRGMQFGTVTLVVQDGRVVQVDRTEKRRLPREAPRG